MPDQAIINYTVLFLHKILPKHKPKQLCWFERFSMGRAQAKIGFRLKVRIPILALDKKHVFRQLKHVTNVTY